ncbi:MULTISPECIES: bifunctional metallophosphatase/5'-nucleotidase [Micromonospora]|uniref:Bifunctional metallophosphatase/5'-nucleotidase n=1 Tax=Micromonospora aurantiaca (nom. illeg.) TaxID=47850 RepID=A0ABQ6U7D5_9ACTN|nr:MULTISPECIES: bifunctional metallophosphatase/5'-nucleotidase [Micromonospora]ADL49437.1 5'-Nucleotidase domain-containing protein [Micromonospora aurantiaca ATCC 27029]ADU08083.1 5'-Nucleotidase domain-containing protein [Micromonospora sp. L5]KAB1102719.1 bifunctional metallophosphatase/5'-nucleotidase [Micromonospora aurantiaca]RNI00707.1 bifunctional metallophosphatase/5'-nucleotidase [Micromonospora aurantiaca]UFN94392.1 bifunctional metallophosphatase/5'-nucleotidase [Micromonospora a
MSVTGMRRRAAVGLAALAATAFTAVAVTPDQAEARPKPVDVQLLAINDFHGNLEPPTGSSGTIEGQPAGGAEYLASHLKSMRAAAKQQGKGTVTVAAGDLIGASPLLSAAFHDEPTIEEMNLAGLEFASVGNHEFDEGAAELLRMQRGGCHPVDGCADGTPFGGAKFKYLSANAFKTSTGLPLMQPFGIKIVKGVPIGFIGMTLEGTPNIVSQQGVAGLRFTDEADTANKYAKILRLLGVKSIVVLLHEGGVQNGGGINDCTGFSGPIVDIANRMDPSIDVIVSGHTHAAYNCNINGKLVTSASSFGRLVTQIDLKIDPRTRDVVTASANNVVVTRDVEKDPASTELINRYKTALGPVADRVVGETTAAITKTQENLYQTGVDVNGKPTYQTGESPLGNLIADAQLAATDTEQNAVAAFMNPGGVRADLDAGPVTYAEAFTVQPFANNLVTLDLTGAQLYCMLEQQFTVARVLYASSTVNYVVDVNGTTAPAGTPCAGTRVVRGSLTINGTPVTDTATYRVTVNNFLAGGGDGFSVLTGGTNAVTGQIDLDAFTAYLTEKSPVSPPALDRIRTTTEVAAG